MKSTALAAVLLALPSAAVARQVPEDFSVKLERAICCGSCPAYAVSVDALGNVSYDGQSHVRVGGHHTTVVPAEKVRQLLEAVDQSGFFDLLSSYRSIDNGDGTAWTVIGGSPTVVTVTVRGRTKRIDYHVGEPERLRALARLIDEVAGTLRWVRIDVETLEWMFLHESLPPIDEQLDMIRNALTYNETEVLRVFLAHGLDPNVEWQGRVPLIQMARSADAINALLTAGANVRVAGGQLLAGIASTSAEATQALLDAGVPVDEAAQPGGRTALWSAACEGNAAVVDVLLAGGANPTIQVGRVSPVQCARQARLQRSPRPPTAPESFRDYDSVIRLLDTALARRK